MRPLTALLAAFFLAPLAEASLARPDAEPMAAAPLSSSLERALAGNIPVSVDSRFDLFDGDELARTGNDHAQRFHPLAAVSLLPEGARLDLAPGPEASYPKTRVWAIDVLGSTLVSRSTELSLETHWACVDFSCGLASGGRKDPLGLAVSVARNGTIVISDESSPTGQTYRISRADAEANRALLQNALLEIGGLSPEEVDRFVMEHDLAARTQAERSQAMGALAAGMSERWLKDTARMEAEVGAGAALGWGAGKLVGAGLRWGMGRLAGTRAGDFLSREITSFLPRGAAAAERSLGAMARNPLSGPVEFEIQPSWTPEQIAHARAAVEAANRALQSGSLSPTGRVSTKGLLARLAGRARAVERARAGAAGRPYRGVAGHGPDTTWTGKPNPPEWQDEDWIVNSSLGAQARRYPIGYRPTEFILTEPPAPPREP